LPEPEATPGALEVAADPERELEALMTGGSGAVALQERIIRFLESGETAKVLILNGSVVIECIDVPSRF